MKTTNKKSYTCKSKGNSKTVNDLIKKFPTMKFTWLCNASNDRPVTGKVQLLFDKNNLCPGLFFEELESFLNLPLPAIYEEKGEFAKYYNTSQGLKKLQQAFNFFTKNN